MTVSEFINKVGFKVDQNTVNEVQNTITNIKSTAATLLGTIGIGISLTQLYAIADEFGQINDSISRANGNAEDLAEVQKEILESANNCFMSYSDMADTVISIKNANSDVFPLDDAAEFAEYVTKIGKNAGYTDGEISSMQSQLIKVVQTGKMASTDVTNLLTSTPALVNSLCEGLGVTSDELKKMADSGQVTASTLKQAIINAESSIDNSFDQMGYGISDVLQNIRNQWGFWVADMNSTLNITTTIAKVMTKGFGIIMNFLNKTSNAVKDLCDFVGGSENLLKAILVIATSLFVVLNWTKIVGMAQKFLGTISSIAKMFTTAKASVLLLVAAIVILFLIIDDFINFMMGNDSVIGTIFDNAGIGAENARQEVFNAWNKIKEFLLNVWDFIKQAAGKFVDTVKGFFERHSDSIKSNFERAWGIIKTFLTGVWTFISQLASTLFGDTEENIDGSTTSTKDKLLAVWQSILDALSSVWDVLYEVGSAAFNAIATVVEVVFGIIQAFWNNWGSTILAWFKGLWDNLGQMVNGFLNVIQGIANFISSVFTGNWQGAWQAIKDIFSGIWDIITAILQQAWNTISTVLTVGLGVLQSIWEAIWGAISGFFQGIWNGIVSFVTGIWATITGLLDEALNGVSEVFSNMLSGITGFIGEIKDSIVNGLTEAIDWIKGLPSEALSWGSDIVSGIADGITGAISKVTDAVSGVADKIRSFLHFSVPDEGPLKDFQSWMPDFIGGLAQGINDNKDRIKEAVAGVADQMSIMANADVVSPSTSSAAMGSTTNNRNVSQNVNINNTFNGDRAIQQNAASAMNSSAQDVTSELARGLAYAR